MSKTESKGRADDIDKLVGRRLKMRRMMLGLNQQEVGEALDVSIQQVQKYEKATNRISSGKLFTLSKFLRVPISYFYSQTEDTTTLASAKFAEDAVSYDATDPAAATEKEVISLIKAFNDVKNPQSRKKIIDLIKAMS
jgi:transcriptional regulator with XRE-family HTH domain